MSRAEPSVETFGRYQLLDRLGQGGMAEVFKAKSFGVEGFEKTLVIKRILPDLARNVDFVDLFIREAKLAVRLSHANVVQVFDLGKVESEGAPPSYFMAMEYVAGVDLATLLVRCRQADLPVPIELAVYVAAEVAKGLDHAHRRRDEQMRPLGIVHCDVSPQNVLLSWDGEVKITDFGIAKARHSLAEVSTGPGHVKGKHSYMSPEQARGDVLDAASDLFSLGTVLYETIGGKNPFAASTSDETLRRVRKGVAPPLEVEREGVDGELADLVNRCMAFSPADRFESAGRLYEALLAYVYSSGVRFGASELSEFLDGFGQPAVAAQPDLALLDTTGAADGVTSAGETITEVTSVPEIRAAQVSPAAASQELHERREASVLVVRFRGTGDPPETWRQHARELLLRYGARVVSEVPRELVGTFGLEQVDARDIENAVRCGLVLVHALGGGVGHVGVGVDAGPLRLGGEGLPIDDPQSAALTKAARGLAYAAKGRVAISEHAARTLRGQFRMKDLSGGQPGRVVGAQRTPEEGQGRFVGRRDELHSLGRLLAEASQRRLQVVGLVGDHGIGKTRLLNEMQRRIARGSFNVGFYSTACAPRGHEVPLSGVSSMLRTLCGVREGDAPERIAAVEPGLRALGLVGEEVEAVLSELGLARTAGSPATNGTLQAAVSRMFHSLAEDRLHVFAWDNAAELDLESAEVLHGVAEHLAHSRAMLLFAARPRQGAPYAGIKGYSEIAVGDLEPDDALRLVVHRIDVAEVPDDLVEFVKERAGGHPMFIEELLHEAVESGAIRVEDGKVVKQNLGGSLAVPRPLRTLLGDRVSRLPDAERDLLVAASVLGAPVDTSVLAAMLAVSIGTVNAAAETLEKKRLLVRQGPVTLGFLSPLLPEVVLSGMEAITRVDLHLKAAEAHQSVLAPTSDQHAAQIARHLAEAGERDRAASFYATSGLAQLDQRRLDHAASDLAKALQLADLDDRSPQELAEWVGGLSRAVQYVRSGSEFPALVRRLNAVLDRRLADDPSLATRVTVDLALTLGAVNCSREALDLLARAEMSTAESHQSVRAVLAARGEVLLRQGEFKDALEALERAAKLPGGEPQERHRTLVVTAQALGVSGRHDDALRSIEEAEKLPGADDGVLAYERDKGRALIHAFRRDWRACADASEKAAELARSARLLHEVALNLHNRGESLLRLGDLPRAYATLQSSVAVARQCGAERMVNHNRMLLDYLDALKGSAPARRDLASRLAYAEEHRFTWDAVSGRILLGRLLRLSGDSDGARRELALARRTAESTHNKLALDDCDRELAELDGRSAELSS